MPADQAKGMACGLPKLWLHVNSAGFETATAPRRAKREPGWRRKWHVLSGEAQTDRLFDHETIERMGADFYRKVFAPAIRRAREQSESYESMGDWIRRRWKPAASLTQSRDGA